MEKLQKGDYFKYNTKLHSDNWQIYEVIFADNERIVITNLLKQFQCTLKNNTDEKILLTLDDVKKECNKIYPPTIYIHPANYTNVLN